jgi:uncharacterized protein (DUF1330 family)
MSVYMSGTITVKDPEKLQDYVARVGETMQPFGAEPVLRARLSKVLAGQAGYQFFALFRFPDAAAVDAWYASAAYQALIPTREAGADAIIAVLEPM